MLQLTRKIHEKKLFIETEFLYNFSWLSWDFNIIINSINNDVNMNKNIPIDINTNINSIINIVLLLVTRLY